MVCRYGTFESIRKLLSTDINDIEAIDNRYCRPIHLLCSNYNTLSDEQQFEIIKKLLSKNVDVNVTLYNGKRPLDLMSTSNNHMSCENILQCVQMLINAGTSCKRIRISFE